MPRQIKKRTNNIFCSGKFKIILKDSNIYIYRNEKLVLTLEQYPYNISSCLGAIIELLKKAYGINFKRIVCVGENHYKTSGIKPKTKRKINRENIDWANANEEMLRES